MHRDLQIQVFTVSEATGEKYEAFSHAAHSKSNILQIQGLKLCMTFHIPYCKIENQTV